MSDNVPNGLVRSDLDIIINQSKSSLLEVPRTVQNKTRKKIFSAKPNAKESRLKKTSSSGFTSS